MKETDVTERCSKYFPTIYFLAFLLLAFFSSSQTINCKSCQLQGMTETWAQHNLKKHNEKRDVLTERHTHNKKEAFVNHIAGTDSLVPTTPHVGKSHEVFSPVNILSNSSRQPALVQHFSTRIFQKKLPKQHVNVQYHFTFGVTDRLSDWMQFSTLRLNQLQFLAFQSVPNQARG